MNATHAIVTGAIHDMNGFAPLGMITVEQYSDAESVPDRNQTDDFCLLLDLWDGADMIDNKHVSGETVAALLGLDVNEIEQRARQKLAEINDLDAEHSRSLAARLTHD